MLVSGPAPSKRSVCWCPVMAGLDRIVMTTARVATRTFPIQVALVPLMGVWPPNGISQAFFAVRTCFPLAILVLPSGLVVRQVVARARAATTTNVRLCYSPLLQGLSPTACFRAGEGTRRPCLAVVRRDCPDGGWWVNDAGSLAGRITARDPRMTYGADEEDEIRDARETARW